MDIFKYFMTYLGAAILILCLAFSGIQSATIKRVTSESAMAGHSTGVFSNDNALQSLAAGNIPSNPSELLEFNQEVESILETGDENLGSLEKHLNRNTEDTSSGKDVELQEMIGLDMNVDLQDEEETSNLVADDDSEPEEPKALSRFERRANVKSRSRRSSHAHYTKRAARHIHYNRYACEYKRHFYFKHNGHPYIILPGVNTTANVLKYTWSECNRRKGPARERIKMHRFVESPNTNNLTNGTNTTTFEESEIEVENLYLCKTGQSFISAAPRLSFLGPILPALIWLLNYGRN